MAVVEESLVSKTWLRWRSYSLAPNHIIFLEGKLRKMGRCASGHCKVLGRSMQ